jgi:8-oxo-dGTP diphosphatase
MTPFPNPTPFTRLELSVMGIVDDRLQVLLARTANTQAGRWALPGGVLRVDLDDSLDAAARRVGREQLGMELPFLRQLCAVGGPTPKSHTPWAMVVRYRALAGVETSGVSTIKRGNGFVWRPVDETTGDSTVAFDHPAVIEQAVLATRAEVGAMDLPLSILPRTFTLGELQVICERILGRQLDKSSFRRRLADAELVEPLEGEMRAGPFRPAQLHRAREERIRAAEAIIH